MIPYGMLTTCGKNPVGGREPRGGHQITAASIIITTGMMVGSNISSSCKEDEELEEGFVAEGGVE